MKQTMAPLGAALLAALSLAIPSFAMPAQAAEKISIGIIGGPAAGAWPWAIAQQQGYFKQAGIEPDFIYVPSAPGLMQQLVAGSLDVIGLDGVVEAVHADAAGAVVGMLRIINGTTPYEFDAKPSIKSVKDLKGQKICLGGIKDITRVYVEQIMKANGLTDNDVSFVIVPNTAERLAALKSGTVAATMLLPPFSFIADKAGFHNIASVRDYAGDIPFAGAFTTAAWAKAHPEAAKKLIHVVNQSIAWFDKNREGSIDLMVKVSHAPRELATESYDLERKIEVMPNSDVVSRGGLVHLIAAMKSIGDLQGETVKADQLIIPGVTPAGP
ncbi:MAG: ABC transporter substrate-binding protein [Xanthobacteraceae bacterium]